MKRSSQPDAVKKAETETLSPDEWDFRDVSNEELYTVLQYEYMRSSGDLVDAIKCWHLRPFNIGRLAEMSFHPPESRLPGVLKRIKNLTNARAIKTVFGSAGSSIIASDQGAHLATFFMTLYASLPEVVREKHADAIAVRFEEFPKPWMALKAFHEAAYLQKRLLPVSERSSGIHANPGNYIETLEIFAAYPYTRRHEFLIDWATPKRELVKDFKKWLDTEYCGVPDEMRRRSGRRTTWELLKWLAAYRLKQSGLTYRQAQYLVNERKIKHPSRSSALVLPIYPKQANWSESISNVTQKLNRNFILELVEVFSPE